ncbi:MAG: DegT/DnrJ/EryC1/StrS family aminotransferase [Patescibacteria group bacterium]
MKNKLAIFGGRPVLKNPLPPYNSLGKEEERAALKVMKTKVLSAFLGREGQYFLGGHYVKELEKKFCQYFKIKYAVSFNSASTALQAAIGALGIGPGDEVITTPFTMSATASAILFNNALPVFCDINENDFCIDPDKIEPLINKNTKAILTVNLFGGTADYSKILKIAKKYNLKIIEDNAQSAGATYKNKFLATIGDIGIFSFNVHKVIQSGEGGMLVTNNKNYAFRTQLIRNHGEAVMNDLKNKGVFEPVLGSNYRMTELQAVIVTEQLKKLKKLNNKKIILANYLTKRLKKFNWLVVPSLPKENIHIYYTYPIRFWDRKIGIKRETFAKAMKAEGFPLGQGYQEPIYLFPMYQKKEVYSHSQFPFVSKDYPHQIDYSKGICPVAERMYEKELLCTDICQPNQTKKEIDLFIKAIEKIELNIKALKDYEKKL